MTPLLNRLSPNMVFARFFAVLAIAVVFIWFGAMNLEGSARPVALSWLSDHPWLKQIPKNIQSWLPVALGGVQLLVGVVVILHAVPGRYKQYSYTVVALMALSSLSLLITNPVWITSLGGFPAIGSGQGLLKYLAVAGVALWLMGYRYASSVMVLGLILVLGWIGGMKFTAPEANGVYPLLTSSPLFNWWAPVYFTKQMASNIIGVTELITVFLLTGWWWNKRLCQLGLLLSAATFLVTLSFMASFGATWSGGSFGSFPLLSGTGHFLLKDIILLAATFALAAELKSSRQG